MGSDSSVVESLEVWLPTGGLAVLPNKKKELERQIDDALARIEDEKQVDPRAPASPEAPEDDEHAPALRLLNWRRW